MFSATTGLIPWKLSYYEIKPFIMGIPKNPCRTPGGPQKPLRESLSWMRLQLRLTFIFNKPNSYSDCINEKMSSLNVSVSFSGFINIYFEQRKIITWLAPAFHKHVYPPVKLYSPKASFCMSTRPSVQHTLRAVIPQTEPVQPASLCVLCLGKLHRV